MTLYIFSRRISHVALRGHGLKILAPGHMSRVKPADHAVFGVRLLAAVAIAVSTIRDAVVRVRAGNHLEVSVEGTMRWRVCLQAATVLIGKPGKIRHVPHRHIVAAVLKHQDKNVGRLLGERGGRKKQAKSKRKYGTHSGGRISEEFYKRLNNMGVITLKLFLNV